MKMLSKSVIKISHTDIWKKEQLQSFRELEKTANRELVTLMASPSLAPRQTPIERQGAAVQESTHAQTGISRFRMSVTEETFFTPSMSEYLRYSCFISCILLRSSQCIFRAVHNTLKTKDAFRTVFPTGTSVPYHGAGPKTYVMLIHVLYFLLMLQSVHGQVPLFQ